MDYSDTKIIKAFHGRIANTTVGPSAVRGMGPKGTVQAARNYLASLKLHKFSKKNEKEFRTFLNRTTQEYLRQLPRGAKHWGMARKLLNIFLREVLYNQYLCKKYDFNHIEPWLEVPLDSYVAKGLRAEPGGEILPKWKTVIGLDQTTSRQFQSFAVKVASRKNIYRVHLDLFYWRRED